MLLAHLMDVLYTFYSIPTLNNLTSCCCCCCQVRAAVLTASQCATYDEVKQRVLAITGWQDGALTHLATAMVAGVISTTATNPVDVVKTHMFVGGWVGSTDLR